MPALKAQALLLGAFGSSISLYSTVRRYGQLSSHAVEGTPPIRAED